MENIVNTEESATKTKQKLETKLKNESESLEKQVKELSDQLVGVE